MMTEIAVPIPHTVSQAGFWRRAFALAIDYAVLALTGILLFQATGGAVRIGQLPMVENLSCMSSASSVRQPAASQTTTTCERSLFGFVHDRWTEVSEYMQPDATTTHTVRTPVDSAGHPVRAFY